MKRQLQPNAWSCLPTAFATVLNRDVSEIIDFLGHDGSEIIFDELDPPFNHRGFNIQEMLDFCMSVGFTFFTAEREMWITDFFLGDIQLPFNHINQEQRFQTYLNNYVGVVAGVGDSGTPHAWSWDRYRLFDSSQAKEQFIHEITPWVFYGIKSLED